MNSTAKPLIETALSDLSARERNGQWLLIAGGVLLGTIGIFVEEAAQHPLITVWFRCIFGALALLLWGLAIGRWKELRLHGWSYWIALITGLLMIINWALFFAAMSRTSIAVATVVFHIQPFWVMLFGFWFLHETVLPRQWVATSVALIGLTLSTGLTLEDLKAGAVNDDYINGLLMCLFGSLSYAAVTVIAKTERQMSSFALAWWQCAVGAVILAWVPVIYGWPSETSAWPWLIGLGVFHTGLAYAILFAGMAKLTLGKVALLQFVYPLTAVVVDWAVYGRILDPVQMVGVGLMAVALWTVKTAKPAIASACD